MSSPIQHIQKSSEFKVAKPLFSLYAAIFVYIYNPIKRSEEKMSILIGRINKKHSMKKTLTIVRLSNSLFIFV
jgi:hypothetical protein